MSTSSLFDHKLRKGDLTGAIGQSIIAADNAKKFARTKAEEISQCQKSIERQTSATLEKYKLL